jgi:integrase
MRKRIYVPAQEQLPEWRWPVNVTAYDTNHGLYEIERVALADLARRRVGGKRRLWTRAYTCFDRLLEPLNDVLGITKATSRTRSGVISVLLREMGERNSSFWGWGRNDWLDILCTDGNVFRDRHKCANDCRHHIMTAAYLLCEVRDFHGIGRFEQLRFADKVFGIDYVEAAVSTVLKEVNDWGYSKTTSSVLALPNLICELLLANGSPRLEDLSRETVELVRDGGMAKRLKSIIVLVSQVLARLEIINSPLTKEVRKTTSDTEHEQSKTGRLTQTGGTKHKRAVISKLTEESEPQGQVGRRNAFLGVPEEWLAWCVRWNETSVSAPGTRSRVFYAILRTGRWLASKHPDVTKPEQWTRDIAADFVASVDRTKVGEWSTSSTVKNKKDLGKPITPRSKDSLLSSARAFFYDCQEWGWMPVRFNPARALATPRSIRILIGPSPRDIADDIWAKLLTAGINLTIEDLPVHYYGPNQKGPSRLYPIEMIRAVALTWLFAGLRANEIRRLRKGCVRWQRDDVVIPSTGATLAKDAVCWLDVPAGKNNAAFTKPVDMVVGEAITVWESNRPRQPVDVDLKTSEVVDYLFSYRGKRIGQTYLNDCLIPILCRKASVPESDAKGDITSHRARSTIATQLLNAKEPMTLSELQEWLGHSSPATTRSYARIRPTRLASAYSKAHYLIRNVRTLNVIIDPEPIKTGEAANGVPWRYYDQGHGLCSYDFFENCAHLMACAKCDFYVPKGSTKAQFIEGKANLMRMRQEMQLSEEEAAAVDGGIKAMEILYRKLEDIPTPTGQTPREMNSEVG